MKSAWGTWGAVVALACGGCDELDGALGSSLENPCSQARAVFDGGEEVWVGCSGSSAGGLFRSSNDGLSWTAAEDLPGSPPGINGASSRVNDLTRSGGDLYVCGGNNEVSPKVFLYRIPSGGGDWEALVNRDTLIDLGGTGFADCQNVVVSGDSITIDDTTGSQIATSTDGGRTWQKADVGQIYDLEATGDALVGAGGTISSGPRLYQGRVGGELAATVAFSDANGVLQEARGVAVARSGALITAGATDGLGDAWIRRSEDDGVTWEEVVVEADDVDFFEDVDCAADSGLCVVVGRVRGNDAAAMFLSEDEGASWRRYINFAETGAFHTVDASTGRVWATGDGDTVSFTP